MELHQLRCFVAVADELHFGKAARKLAMLPTALGRHVRLLEEDLGTRLLERTTRYVALTQSGAAFLDDARALLAEAERIASRAHAGADLAFVRPPHTKDPRFEFLFLFHETAVVALPSRHRLARRSRVTLRERRVQLPWPAKRL